MLGRDTRLTVLMASQALLGVGVGLFNAPNMVATLNHVQGRHLAVASGLMGSMRTMGGLFSQVLGSLIIGHYVGNAPVTPETADSFMTAMRVSLICFAALNLCGIFIGMRRMLPARKGGRRGGKRPEDAGRS